MTFIFFGVLIDAINGVHIEEREEEGLDRIVGGVNESLNDVVLGSGRLHGCSKLSN